MEDNKIDLFLLLKFIFKDRKKLVVYLLCAALLGVLIAISIPRQYYCSAIITPETRNGKASSMASMGALAGMMGMNIGVTSRGFNEKLYPAIISSKPFLMSFKDMQVTKKDGTEVSLYKYLTEEQKSPWWNYISGLPSKVLSLISGSNNQGNANVAAKSNELSHNDLIFCATLNSSIKIELSKTTGSISFEISAQDPKVCLQISDSVIDKLQKFVVEYYTSKAKYNMENSTKMMDEAKKVYYDADQNYAEAYDRNRNLISRVAEIKIDRLKNERDLAFTIYQQLASQVEVDKIKLLEQTPVFTIIDPPILPIFASKPKKIVIVFVFCFLGVMAFATRKTIVYIINN